MATINPFLPADKYVVRCYNSQPFGNTSSTAPCGITVTRSEALGQVVYRVDFGFNVEERFVSLTPLGYGQPVAYVIGQQIGNFVDLQFYTLADPPQSVDSLFTIIVY